VYQIAGEQVAHLAGFPFSVGNWIAPNGHLIIGDKDSDHYSALVVHLGESPDKENSLKWMNDKVEQEGYIRLVFRNEVWFHTNCKNKESIWEPQLNFQRMVDILKQIGHSFIPPHRA